MRKRNRREIVWRENSGTNQGIIIDEKSILLELCVVMGEMQRGRGANQVGEEY